MPECATDRATGLHALPAMTELRLPAQRIDRRRLLRGDDQRRVVRQREVVVAAEGDQLAAAAARLRGAVAIGRDELAAQARALERGELSTRVAFEGIHGRL